MATCPKPLLQRPTRPAKDTIVAQFIHALRTGTVRAPNVLVIILIIAASCALAYQGRAAVAQDLKTFNATESYLADGQSITLTQKLGQVIIQFDPAVTQNATPTAFIAPNGTPFVLDVDLTPARGLYTMQTGGTVTESANAAAIDSVNTESRVKYAYPVFANPGSGARHYLNYEIVVRLKAQITPDDVASFQQLGLEVVETLSSSDNIHVLRLFDPKNYNPFSICSALLQNPVVLWDEPNMEQEGGALFTPNDAKYGDQWHLPKVSAPSAWNLTLGSPGIRIAILDNGVIWQNQGTEVTHPDLQPNIIQGYDFKDMDADPNPSTSG